MSRILSLILSSLIVALAISSLARADGPPRWVMADEDTKITLIGTFHVLPADMQWMQPDIKASIAEADTLYFEMAPDQEAPAVIVPLVNQMGYWSGGEKLSSYVSEDTMRGLSDIMGAVGITAPILERMEPWFVTVNLISIQFQALGWNPQFGAEKVLQRLAQQNGVSMQGLETAEFQMSLFDTLPVESQVAFLETTLKAFDTLEADSAKIVEAWSKGDAAAIDEEMNKSLKGHEQLLTRLLIDRNRTWVAAIQQLMDDPGNIVVAVGAGHLVGQGSVISMLEEAGYSPTRLQP